MDAGVKAIARRIESPATEVATQARRRCPRRNAHGLRARALDRCRQTGGSAPQSRQLHPGPIWPGRRPDEGGAGRHARHQSTRMRSQGPNGGSVPRLSVMKKGLRTGNGGSSTQPAPWRPGACCMPEGICRVRGSMCTCSTRMEGPWRCPPRPRHLQALRVGCRDRRRPQGAGRGPPRPRPTGRRTRSGTSTQGRASAFSWGRRSPASTSPASSHRHLARVDQERPFAPGRSPEPLVA